MKRSSLFSSLTENELFVSQILLDLENLVSIHQEPNKKLAWGCKKKRSSSRVGPYGDETEVKEGGAAASSPDTPLSFSSSESDDKCKNSPRKNYYRKRSREEYIDMIQGLTQRGDLLRGEIENVKKYYDKLKACNSQLKAMKHEVLNSFPRKEPSQTEISRFITLGLDTTTPQYQMTTWPHSQPFIPDRLAQKFLYSFGPITASSGNGLGSVGPIGIPDLNLSAEEAFGVDSSQLLDVNGALADKRARFAEARRLRKGIIKIKSMRSACGIKLPRTNR